MIRQTTRLLNAAALIALFVPVFHAAAQQHVPPAPDSAVPQAPAPSAPTVPAPAAAPTFPAPNPADFTADTPTKDTVSSFLNAIWGYDENRMWQVQAIRKTPVDGISQVIVLIGDKTGKEKPQVLAFYALADGKHIIVAEQNGPQIIDFGAQPFADNRAQLQQKADGPYRGSASKDLELVEFADFQCPHCKEAQANMDKLATDFPNARIVFQIWPISQIHPQAMSAAEYGVCVTKMAGSAAFFQYAAAVFDGQDGLATPDGATLTLNSAVTKAGLDPAKVAACAATPEAKAQVDASFKLGQDVGVISTPELAVNGHMVQPNMPYEDLKKIVAFQAKLDGVASSK